MQPSLPSNTVAVDIESMVPWQKETLNKMYGGIARGELCVMMAGRQQGKSQIVAYQRMIKDILEIDAKVTTIALDEGTVYGSRYYTAEPVGGNWLEMETWCGKVFGPGSRALWGEKKAPEPARRWYANNRKFWFRSEKDRTLFIVKWSS